MKLWAIVPELIVAGACVPLVAGAGFARGRGRRLPFIFATVALLAAMAATLRMVPWAPVETFGATYIADRLGTVFKFIVECGALITLWLLPGQFVNDEVIPHAPAALLFAAAGAMALCSSADLGLIVLFFQMMSLASYVLAALERRSLRGQEAALKFFIFGGTALAVMAYGLTFLYGMTGSLDLAAIGAAAGGSDALWLAVALTLVVVGYGFELTLVPFHLWSPDVFDGATAPVSGFLSVVPKVAGFAALLRFVTVAMPAAGGWPVALAVAAAVTMTLGNLVALRQTGLKRLLAYSSIGQAGYILAASAVATRAPGAIDAVSFYLLAYAFMNLAAFGVVAAVERARGGDGLGVLNGLGRASPWAGAVLLFALLSLAGIPPFGGFAGKVLVLQAMMQGGMPWLAVVAALNMVVGLYYYAMLAGRLYFDGPPAAAAAPLGGPAAAALSVATAGTVLLGVWPAIGFFR